MNKPGVGRPLLHSGRALRPESAERWKTHTAELTGICCTPRSTGHSVRQDYAHSHANKTEVCGRSPYTKFRLLWLMTCNECVWGQALFPSTQKTAVAWINPCERS